MAIWIVKIAAVIAMLGAAAALATPRGRLPLAMRAVRRMVRKDRGLPDEGEEVSVPGWKRLTAFALIVAAAIACML